MRVRPEKQREGIISLTQTEIMLVLTVVVLLLLSLKNSDLSKVCSEAPSVCEQLNVLADQSKNSQAGGERPEIDKDQEITGDLVPGDGTQGTASSSILEEERQAQQEVRVAEKEEELHALRSENVVLRAQNTILKDQIAQTEQFPDLREENQRLLAENAELRKRPLESSVPLAPAQRQQLRDEVGFVPCWLSDKGQTKRYYSAFDLTYHQGRDRITVSPHRDWQRNDALIVQKALADGLQVLTSYPRGEVSRQQFLEFARRVQAAKNSVYGKECRLVVTINGNVQAQFTSNFLYDKAGFYPVVR